MMERYSAKPIRMWIDGITFSMVQKYQQRKKSRNNGDETATMNSGTEILQHDFTVNSDPTGKLTTTFRLPTMYYIRLNSFPNFDLKLLETETKTQISLPKNGADGVIAISGSTMTDVVNARSNLQCVISQIREKEPPTHFIGIPVHTEEVQTNFEKFKELLLNGNIRGVDETIFQGSHKLHLTIAMCSLLDNLEKDEAISVLDDCKTNILNPFFQNYGRLRIKIQGINAMNENLEKVHILYANAKIEHENDVNILQNLVDNVSGFFYERGLVRQYQDNVKLHVTLINTKKRKSSEENPKTPKRFMRYAKRQPFDARDIMEQYKDYYFGESTLDSIHLSYISIKGEDNYYKPLSIINF